MMLILLGRIRAHACTTICSLSFMTDQRSLNIQIRSIRYFISQKCCNLSTMMTCAVIGTRLTSSKAWLCQLRYSRACVIGQHNVKTRNAYSLRVLKMSFLLPHFDKLVEQDSSSLYTGMSLTAYFEQTVELGWCRFLESVSVFGFFRF